MKKISEIIEEKHVFSEILESIHNAIILIDENKKVLFANSNVGSLFGIAGKKIPETYEKSILGNFLNCKNDCTVCHGCELDKAVKKLINHVKPQKQLEKIINS